jgi:hypothetical protein
MASTLKINTLTGVTTAGSIAVTGEGNSTTTNLQNGLAKAWVNFNHTTIDSGTDLDGVRKSFNIASVVDVDTGRANTNLTNPMADADHISTGSAGDASQGAGRNIYLDDGGGNTSSTIVSNVENNSGSVVDPEYVAIVTHGDLA